MEILDLLHFTDDDYFLCYRWFFFFSRHELQTCLVQQLHSPFKAFAFSWAALSLFCTWVLRGQSEMRLDRVQDPLSGSFSYEIPLHSSVLLVSPLPFSIPRPEGLWVCPCVHLLLFCHVDWALSWAKSSRVQKLLTAPCRLCEQHSPPVFSALSPVAFVTFCLLSRFLFSAG